MYIQATLTGQDEEFVKQKIASGEYQTPSDVVRAALRFLIKELGV